MDNFMQNTKTKLFTLLIASSLWACNKSATNTTTEGEATTDTSTSESVTLEKKWETEGNLLTPESVLYDRTNKVLYVSNINGQPGEKDGNGSIGKVDLNGKIEQAEWVKGLDAPKGMGLHNDQLYVADLIKVVVIDIKTGKKVKDIPLPEAQFLNDITVDAEGNIYVSDSSAKKVYLISGDKASVYMQSDSLERPNGLLAHEGKLFLVDMQPGIFYEIDKSTKALNKVAEGLTSGDGIVPVGNGDYVVSNWNGEINYLFANGQVKKLLDTKDAKINAADIDIIPDQNLVLVPTFFNNKIMAYELKR
ncbi:SMP-30/gluconolactonase/LRE family protein [Adhaeribacter rhizoryzae]|uniref:ATP/GTP-binding protein n=1 Tax=Adhaeribacter rhizoryzae TaxID=2607907 RepID=A0A5M6DG10_9BACT|nr:ATP/GTP-binding protein [Adhaeribacter rhizoryzae]KAA5546458.1 ATP/GTP-binding protein [Adhaeribacter rhizoryzae]